jgi:hypothetical protein
MMRAKITRVVVEIALLICLVCPLVEMFDHWDHTVQTGNDTEYALVVLAFCVGAAYSIVRFIPRFSLRGFLAEALSNSCTHKTLPSALFKCSLVIPISISPPTLALRI